MAAVRADVTIDDLGRRPVLGHAQAETPGDAVKAEELEEQPQPPDHLTAALEGEILLVELPGHRAVGAFTPTRAAAEGLFQQLFSAWQK